MEETLILSRTMMIAFSVIAFTLLVNQAEASEPSWTCHAQGYGAGNWKEFVGEHKTSRLEAQASALHECHAQVPVCQLGACWQK